VVVGANGVGKSALFEFLRFLRTSMYNKIPPEIVTGGEGQQVFHSPGAQKICWSLEVADSKDLHLYSGELLGPPGRVRIQSETVVDLSTSARLLDLRGGSGVMFDPASSPTSTEISADETGRLGLSTISQRDSESLYSLRRDIGQTRFYDAARIDRETIRRSIRVDESPFLEENFSNLSAVLFYLMTERPDRFEEIQATLRLSISDFKRLSVKARGVPGEVIAFYEQRDGTELTIADLSDGTMRLLCWATLCNRSRRGVTCVDEPDQGFHPRILPIIADMFRKAALSRQCLISTHSSYFLRQFGLSEIAVIRKENGEPKWVKPSDSKILRESLTDFGEGEIERMHRSEELEQLA